MDLLWTSQIILWILESKRRVRNAFLKSVLSGALCLLVAAKHRRGVILGKVLLLIGNILATNGVGELLLMPIPAGSLIELLRLFYVYLSNRDTIMKSHAVGIWRIGHFSNVLVCVLTNTHILAVLLRHTSTILWRLHKRLLSVPPLLMVTNGGTLPTLILSVTSSRVGHVIIFKSGLAISVSQFLVAVNDILNKSTGSLRPMATERWQFGIIMYCYGLLFVF